MRGSSDIDMAALGRAISGHRTMVGLTSYALAKRAGVGDMYLRRLERGHGSRVGLGTLCALSAALGLDVADLLYDAGLSVGAGSRKEMDDVYEQLTTPERRALSKVARALLELRDERSGDDCDEEEPVQLEERRSSPDRRRPKATGS